MTNLNYCSTGKVEGGVVFSKAHKDYVVWVKDKESVRPEWYGPYPVRSKAVQTLKEMVSHDAS